MIRARIHKWVSLFLMCALMATTAAADTGKNREWAFKVSLDGKEVGSQRFMLEDDGGKLRMETQAELNVKLFFITVYRYWHENTETWENGCLQSIESRTKVNGKSLAVKGQRNGDYFQVIEPEDGGRLPDCVMSFAYWNPRFLQESRLLNSQNGQYMEVDVNGPVADEIPVRGEMQPAQRYELRAGDLDLQLWYSNNDRWLALESTVKGGRILSYELM